MIAGTIYPRFAPARPTATEMAEVAGDYRCPELDLTYAVAVEGDHLAARSIWSAV